MVKLIGLLLIFSSLVTLAVGAFIDFKYGSTAQITGNIMVSIVTQPQVNLSFLDYIEAITFSYSIFSFIIGIIFLMRV